MSDESMSDESLNSNGDLDRICCEFAGIEPLPFKCPLTRGSRGSCGDARDPEQCAACDRHERTFPPVSTDGGACWRLIDALATRGDKPNSRRRSVAIDMGVDAHGFFFGVRTGAEVFHGNHKSGPMALALAVAQLAKREATA